MAALSPNAFPAFAQHEELRDTHGPAQQTLTAAGRHPSLPSPVSHRKDLQPALLGSERLTSRPLAKAEVLRAGEPPKHFTRFQRVLGELAAAKVSADRRFLAVFAVFAGN
jgi:hypothetical protein